MLKKIIVILLISWHFSFVSCGFFTGPIIRRSQKKVHSVKKGFQEQDKTEEDNKSKAETWSKSDPHEARLKKHKSGWEVGPWIEINSANDMSNGNHTTTKFTSTHRLYLKDPSIPRIVHTRIAANPFVMARSSDSGKSLSMRHSSNNRKCIEKCFTPNCDVQCIGRLGSAACTANSCRSKTHGEFSVSMCTGTQCHATCFHEKCTSGCEGPVCQSTCNGKRCYAISHGRSSRTECGMDECSVYSNGIYVHAQCSGFACQAHCLGTDCSARCNGTNCISGCKGHDCRAECFGEDCQHRVLNEKRINQKEKAGSNSSVTSSSLSSDTGGTISKDISTSNDTGISTSSAIGSSGSSVTGGQLNAGQNTVEIEHRGDASVQKIDQKKGDITIEKRNSSAYDMAFQLNEDVDNFLKKMIADFKQNLPTLGLLIV